MAIERTKTSSEAACRTTHAQVLAEHCPWCGAGIGAQPPADAPCERRWNIPRLKADLNHEDIEARMVTIQNVGSHFSDVAEAVNVLRIALAHPEQPVREAATGVFAWLGGRLAAEAIDTFEMSVLKRKQQDDLAIRIMLLGYYGAVLSGLRLRSTRQVRPRWRWWQRLPREDADHGQSRPLARGRHIPSGHGFGISAIDDSADNDG